jgi:serine/threonine protein kinase/Tol biopolymer transport system component
VTPERWQEIERLYHSAPSLESGHRDSFLKDACAGDESLRREVEQLLASQPRIERFIESSALEVAAKILATTRPTSNAPNLVDRTLTHYHILEKIGVGGMGDVYRARDGRLGRDVAVKVLPAEFVTDPKRKQRFIREAKAASALNHPNIITVHEIANDRDLDFIVMEYVAGKTLDQSIGPKGFRLPVALNYATQIAEALAAAHAAGIVHRDLKPGNVMITASGLVKLLDFGLAKLTESARGSLVPSESQHPDSEEGRIFGTAAYMSPEQAEGKAVDARSDIFSFGSLLYEMFTGQRAFQGDSKLSTLSAILHREPKPVCEIIVSLPPEVEHLVRRCLRKDPARRFQHIDDVKVALLDIKEDSDSGAVRPVPVGRRRRAPLMVLIAGTVVVVSAATAWELRSHHPVEAPPPHVVPLTALEGPRWHPTFSPDGEQVAFEWNGARHDNSDIYVTLVGSSDIRRLTTDPAADSKPTWSPDGRQIAFLRERPDGTTIQLVSPLGGADRKLGDFRGADSIGWSSDSQWLGAGRSREQGIDGPPRGIYLIPVDGGDPRPLIASSPLIADSNPAFSPDGRRLAYTSCRHDRFSLPSYFRGHAGGCDLYLVELNPARTPSAPPRRLTTQRLTSVGSVTWTRDGSGVVYAAAAPAEYSYLWRVDADGTRPPERIEVAGSAVDPAVALTRDRLAFVRDLFDLDIYRFEVGRPVQVVIGSNAVENEARLSPDGRRLAFASRRSGSPGEIWVADADGSNAQSLTHGMAGFHGSPYWSPDGRRIVFDSIDDDFHYHIWIVDADGGSPRRLTTQADNEHAPTWSRDGRWIYFSSVQGSAARDLWRVSVDGRTSERLIRGGSGPFACETFDGKGLLFQPKGADSSLMAMPLTGGAAKQLVACVRRSAFGVGPLGVYYVPCDPSPNPPVRVMNLETGNDLRLGTLEGLYPPMGLAVSPDGRTILYPRITNQNTDLMLIENFR